MSTLPSHAPPIAWAVARAPRRLPSWPTEASASKAPGRDISSSATTPVRAPAP